MIEYAILGFGVVGSGVAEVTSCNSDLIGRRAGEVLSPKYILDVRDFPDSPFGDKIVHDFSVIEQDPAVRIVVETIGGRGVAYDFTKRALRAGKHVVTSNKELVAAHGTELLRMARAHGVSYMFEASVGGGIPVIRPLAQCLAANDLREITGILNGTTNYILTRMIRAGLSFEEALKEAQAKGYAEQDPTADVDGHDACRKICILSALGYGRHILPEQVKSEGIRNIQLCDVEYAKNAGYVIKLLGRSVRLDDGRVAVFVAPHLIPHASPLSGVEDVFNAVLLNGNAVGDVMFYGRGAGKLPTASAVVADMIDITRHIDTTRLSDWDDPDPAYVADENVLPYAFYLRVKDGPSVKEKLSAVFAGVQWLSEANGELVFITAAAPTRDITAALDTLRAQGVETLASLRVLPLAE